MSSSDNVFRREFDTLSECEKKIAIGAAIEGVEWED